MHLFMSLLPVLNLSFDNLLAALVVVIVVIILFVALWRYIAPYLGQFAYLVGALVVVFAILLIAHFLGVL